MAEFEMTRRVSGAFSFQLPTFGDFFESALGAQKFHKGRSGSFVSLIILDGNLQRWFHHFMLASISEGRKRGYNMPGITMRCSWLIVVAALCAVGCTKQSNSPSTSITESPEDAAARTRAVQDGLGPSMSDEQILRKIGYDPAALTSHRTDGVDGSTMTYSNETTCIFITRSIVTGISILRLQPKEQQQHWMLRNP